MAEDKEVSPSMAVGAPESPSESDTTQVSTRRRGRPSKAEIAAHKPGGRKKVGRPAGQKAIMDDYKARMLASPKSRKVIKKVLDTALEDGHPHQAACMKMVMDRILPASSFDEAKTSGGVNVEINFVDMAGKAEVVAPDSESAVDADFVELPDE